MFLLTVILTIVLYADVVDYNVDDLTSPFMPLEKSTLTIQSFLVRADKEVDDHLKTNSLLWMF